jgi:F-type H+-transporting ATPase subunit delta
LIRSRIVKRYTRALFELAQEAGSREEVGQDLSAFDGFLAGDEDLREALLSPVLTRDVKAQVLDAVLDATGPNPYVANFLRVLLEARKLSLLSQMVAAFRDLADEAAGRVQGTVAASMPLEEADVKALSEALSRTLRKEVRLGSELDPALCGGVVARVGNLVFDGSVRTQLQRMRETLIKG